MEKRPHPRWTGVSHARYWGQGRSGGVGSVTSGDGDAPGALNTSVERDGLGAAPACLRVARGRVLVRGLLLAVAAVLIGFVLVTVLSGLDFKPTGVSNRLVEYAIAAAMLPFAVLGIWCAVTAIRWILLAAWPGPVGAVLEDDALVLSLGPWGRRRFEWDLLDVRYWFEHDPDELQGMVEAFLPEAEQRARFLPQMRYPGESSSINKRLLRGTGRSEQEAADALREAIASRRRSRVDDSAAGEGESEVEEVTPA